MTGTSGLNKPGSRDSADWQGKKRGERRGVREGERYKEEVLTISLQAGEEEEKEEVKNRRYGKVVSGKVEAEPTYRTWG
jgi:hypothetical protein